MKARKWLSVLFTVLLLLSLTACGASTESMNREMAYDSVDTNESSDILYRSYESVDTTPAESRKWIVTIDMDAETEDMDVLLSQLSVKIDALGGYVEDQNIYNGSSYSTRRYRSASLTVRVPADRADEFTAEVAGISNIVSSNKNLEDVTLSYAATQSRLNALEAEEARLLELMAQAENMSDLLEIEARLTDVRYELESVTSQLRLYDNQVDYATIYLYISEVQEYTVVEEQTVWQRISEGFTDSLKGLWNIIVELFVFIVANSPYLLVIAAIVGLIVFLAKRDAKKRKSARKPPFPTQPPQTPPETE